MGNACESLCGKESENFTSDLAPKSNGSGKDFALNTSGSDRSNKSNYEYRKRGQLDGGEMDKPKSDIDFLNLESYQISN